MSNLFQANLNGLEVTQSSRNTSFHMARHHMHNSYEIYYLISGQIQYFIEDKTYDIHAGSIVFINRNIIHRTASYGETPHVRFLFDIPPAYFEEIRSFFGDSLNDLLQRNALVIRLKETAQQEIHNLCFSIRKELEEKEKLYPQRVHLSVLNLFSYILRAESSPTEENQAKTSSELKIQSIIEYLSNHAHKPISLNELSTKFFIEKTYLCHVFKASTGMTVLKYIHLRRVRFAGNLLLNTDRSISDIAAVSGYGSIAHFERVFHQHMGQAPRDYRKKEKKD